MNNLYYMDPYDYNEGYGFKYCSENLPLERTNPNFYGESEGFVKGNVQKSIYSPYRGYNPSIPTVNGEKDRYLLEIQKYGFYLTDLGLYLDMHPNDQQALALFNENRAKYYKLVNEFNNTYYPLMASCSAGINSYKWLDGNFPMGGRN